jgi:hypothetical protein
MHKKNGKIKLSLTGAVLLCSLIIAFVWPDLLVRFFTCKIIFFRVYHLLWLLVATLLIRRMVPYFSIKVSSGKIFEKHYANTGVKTPEKEEKLRTYNSKTNKGALLTAIYWTIVILVTGALYYFHIFMRLHIFLVVVFFVFMDSFCASIWCPFQWLIGNKCCNSCRVNNWGYLMAFAPLLYLPSFWTYSIIFLSVALVIQWEYIFHKYPERFFELYNANLMCRNCAKKCALR